MTQPRGGPATAVEQNAASFLLALGRAGGAEERDEPRLRWTIGGSPIDYHNAVVHADLPAGEADAAIRAARERMRARGVAGSWHLGPSMRPPDLAGRLVAHGFVHAGDEAGMAADLGRLGDPRPMPDGLTVERVVDRQGLAAWRDTLARGFGAGPHEAVWVAAMYARIGLGDAAPWRHYLGRLDGAPVATASVHFAAGAAGIYFVFTVAEARRQGIGTAVTRAAMGEARSLGFRLAVLGSSPMGENVYRRIGFRECCRIGIYEWREP